MEKGRAMGSIIERKLADGIIGHTAQIRKKKAGKMLYNMSQTFERKRSAVIWMEKTEKDLLNGARSPDSGNPRKPWEK